ADLRVRGAPPRDQPSRSGTARRARPDTRPAGDATRSGATTAPAQAGLGHEAQGLADRVERALRKKVTTVTRRPS
ncbi:hypothetical protein ABZS63_40020, partial [Streptomyces sp. NPDC005568]